MKHDWSSYKAGKEAFWDLLVDYDVRNIDDYCVGILHAAIEWVEELDVSDGVVRTLKDSGEGITGNVM